MGHGHVTPNPDGTKARCGGPSICSECATEAGRLGVAYSLQPAIDAARTAAARRERHRQLGLKAIHGTATRDELIEYATLELFDCVDSLEPSAPKNGRAVDGNHASACALRAIATLMQLRRAEYVRPEPTLMPGDLERRD